MSATPPEVGAFMRGLAKLLFFLMGWRTEGAVHQPQRFVIIAAPHTSNWDAVLMVAAAFIFGIRIAWFIKREAFFFPLGTLIRAVGGMPIDRGARRNVVTQAVEQFAQSERLVLAVPPEGTRGKAEGWKTGFYHIAHGAGVPIVLGYLDYRRKVAGLGPAFVPTGDIEADFRVFDEFYAGVTPKHPEQRGPVVPTRVASMPQRRSAGRGDAGQ
jgi:1-acyl-sn-glycerol-3-phosphate acyltransferase